MKELGVFVPMVTRSTRSGDADTAGLRSVCQVMRQSCCYAIFGASRTDWGPLQEGHRWQGRTNGRHCQFPHQVLAVIAGALKTTKWLSGTRQVIGTLVFGSTSLLLCIPVVSPATVDDRCRLIMICDNPDAFQSG
jgi:hypothetical protein